MVDIGIVVSRIVAIKRSGMPRALNDFKVMLAEMKLRSARNALRKLWINFIDWEDESGRWNVTLFRQKVLLEAIDIPHAIVEAEAIVSWSCFES